VRYFIVCFAFVGLLAAVRAQTLSSNSASIRVVAKLPPRAEILKIETTAGATCSGVGFDTMVLDTAAGEPLTVSFIFRANTRSLRIRAEAESSSASVDVAPVASSCDWVHDRGVVRSKRMIAALSRCRPFESQTAMVRMGARAQPMKLKVILEPVLD
jgi:hypothetical protein